MHHQAEPALSASDIALFVLNGYVRIDQAFSRHCQTNQKLVRQRILSP
jgi:hypothetical protein